MRISFDLDDTLICDRATVPYEPNRVPFFLRFWFREPLRLGTCELIAKLKQHGFEICIYTTSYRSPFYIRLWLSFYGIHLSEIINQKIHHACLASDPSICLSSKYPPAFGIKIHIDDAEGVKLEGQKYGFEVIIISPTDRNWTDRILSMLPQLDTKNC